MQTIAFLVNGNQLSQLSGNISKVKDRLKVVVKMRDTSSAYQRRKALGILSVPPDDLSLMLSTKDKMPSHDIKGALK